MNLLCIVAGIKLRCCTHPKTARSGTDCPHKDKTLISTIQSVSVHLASVSGEIIICGVQSEAKPHDFWTHIKS